MTPTIALVILLTIVAMRPFFEVPEVTARAEALRRGGYKPNASQGCLRLLLIPALLGLWWWYALSTDQIMLGIIPTVGTVATLVVFAAERAATKQAAR